MKPLLVLVDQLSDWQPYYPTRQVITIGDFLAGQTEARGYVINLCSDYSYLSTGYYGSLLAEARGGQVFPGVRAIRELNNFEQGQPLPTKTSRVLEADRRSNKRNADQVTLRVYFGQTDNTSLKPVARKLFETFAFPVFDAVLQRVHENLWIIGSLNVVAINELNDSDETRFAESLDTFSSKIWRLKRINKRYKYDLAILVNPEEQLPPSNKGALTAFEKAGKDIGLNVELITWKEAHRIAEYDALFIRETTNVDHHTYRIAQQAENAGLVVIDSPRDIMRCSNKVYLHECLQLHQVDTPETRLLMTQQDYNIDHLIEELELPIIVKVPDGAFSIGVEKAKTREELQECISRLGQRSALLLLQKFMPTEYDWRIGVLNGEAIYACRYFMAKSHWQIYNHSARSKSNSSGNADAFAINDVPKKIIKTALKAARCMGDGFYGVDLKSSGDRVVVIEVNDNPSIDKGVEDLHEGAALYQKIMQTFLMKLDEVNGR